MRRFFFDIEQITGDLIQIPSREKKHIEQVLRLRSGDRIIFFDGLGREYESVLLPKRDGVLWARVEQINEQSRMPEIKIHLGQGMAKGGKMDYVIQKAAELGVCTFTPIINHYSIVQLDEQKTEQKRTRWQSIANEASKQCGRNTWLKVEPACVWEKAISALNQQKILVLYEKEKTINLKMILPRWRRENVREIFLFVGPEGGYAPEEIELALSMGGTIAGLGPRILRTETAGLAAASIILYEWEELK